MNLRRRTGLSGWAAGLLLLAAPPQSPPSLTPSALPLDLVGVLVDTAVPSRSVCLIRRTYPQKKTGVFRPGQKTFDYAEVREIRREGVVLLNLVTNGPEFLAFPEDRPLPLAAPPPAPPVLAQDKGVVKVEVPRAMVDHYLKDLPALLDSAFAAPRYRDGRPGGKMIEGFVISRIREGGIVDQLGIRDGDIILEVNGEPLDSLAAVMRLLGGARTAPRSRVTVVRDGRKMDFVFQRTS